MNLHSDHAHLGDLIWSLTFLSKIRGEHTLRCKAEYVEQLRELVEGLPITVDDCSHVPSTSLDCWIASGMFESRGVRYQDDIDILGFVAKYFNAMASETGHAPVFLDREDLLCDFPALKPAEIEHQFRGVLVINADPKSGQCPRYSSSEMDLLIGLLDQAGHSVCAIDGGGLSLAQIGRIATTAKLIVGCATGPWWPCMSVAAKSIPKVVMLDPMRLNYGENVPIAHAPDAANVGYILEGMGYL